MRTRVWITLIVLYSAFFLTVSQKLFGDADQLVRALLCVEELNKNEGVVPTTYNHLLQGGYWVMPSARMGTSGELGAGVSSVPPYRSTNLRLQFLSHLEITGNYRLFCGIPDPILSPFGYGDLSERGLNVKLTLINPEESHYALPGIAIGFDDIAGTKSFRGQYIVATQLLPDYGLELSLGFGHMRIKGFFGGILWMPYTLTHGFFAEKAHAWLKPLCIGAEYDATDYHNPLRELHPRGRQVDSRINWGCKYRLWDAINFSASYIRGKKFAFSCDVVWSIGTHGEWVTKSENPLPFTGSFCSNILTDEHDEDLNGPSPYLLAIKELEVTFKQQGFCLLKAQIEENTCGQTLRLVVTNDRYYWQADTQLRLSALISCVKAPLIELFVVEIEENGCSVQEYRFSRANIERYQSGKIHAGLFAELSPLKEVSCSTGVTAPLLIAKRPRFAPFLDPKTASLFGSAGGKWKYALGISTGSQGYLPGDFFYSLSLGYFALSTMPRNSCCDCLNPSKLPNVQTNEILFIKKGKLTLDEAFLQKSVNLYQGHFVRTAAGYFDVMYGGVVAEWLYFPVGSAWALGAECSYLRQRIPGKARFTNRIRQCKRGKEQWIRFPLYQVFVDVYYHWFSANVDAQVTFGHFLAGDIGARFGLSHSYPSGFCVTAWYTPTNARDRINGSTYYDTGIGFTMPLDLFYTCSSRKEWGSGLSPWLRDCGVRRFLGNPLYPTLRAARR